MELICSMLSNSYNSCYQTDIVLKNINIRFQIFGDVQKMKCKSRSKQSKNLKEILISGYQIRPSLVSCSLLWLSFTTTQSSKSLKIVHLKFSILKSLMFDIVRGCKNLPNWYYFCLLLETHCKINLFFCKCRKCSFLIVRTFWCFERVYLSSIIRLI